MQQKVDNTILAPVTDSNSYNERPTPSVLLFDSGVGGLSIYEEIIQQIPSLSVIYAFDNEGFPYGEKRAEVIIERIVNLLDILVARHHPDVIVIACNTASTVVLPTLRRCFKQPVVGVVPAIKPAAKLTKNRTIGLLATKATVQRSYTNELIAQFAQGCRVEKIGSSRLVVLAENKLKGHPIVIDEIRQILQPWLIMESAPDTIILGCTHFPLLKEEIKQVLPKETRLVDSGQAIAKRVAFLLADKIKPLSQGDKVAYCTKWNKDVEEVEKTFKNRGFSELKEQVITCAV